MQKIVVALSSVYHTVFSSHTYLWKWVLINYNLDVRLIELLKSISLIHHMTIFKMLAFESMRSNMEFEPDESRPHHHTLFLLDSV
jgi:hypothetical protein